MQSLAPGEEGLCLSFGVFDIFEDLQSLITMLQGFLQVALSSEGLAQGAKGFALKFPVLDVAGDIQRFSAVINGLIDGNKSLSTNSLMLLLFKEPGQLASCSTRIDFQIEICIYLD